MIKVTEMQSTVENRPLNLLSVLQLGFSLVAIALLLSGAAGMGSLGIFAAMMGQSDVDPQVVLLTSASLFGIAILLIPSVYYSLFRILGKPTIDSRTRIASLRPGTWMLLFPVLLVIGFMASRSPTLSWMVLPFLHVPAIGLPIAWMVSLSVRGLPLGSSQRMWGVFNSGLALGPFLISLFEGLAVVGMVVVAIVYISSKPDLIADLTAIAEMTQNGQATEAELMEAISPYTLRPGVILAVFSLGAVIVPMIEEALKPIGVWLLAGRPLSASAGFTAGVLSGAGFALTESLLLSSNSGEWPLLVIVRMGTGAIHILTAALTGWALALAWKRRKYLQLGLTYLIAVIIHALWNGLTIATVFSSLAIAQNQPGALPIIDRLAVAAPLTLLTLAVGCLLILIFYNRRLNRAIGRSKMDRPAPPAAPQQNTSASEL